MAGFAEYQPGVGGDHGNPVVRTTVRAAGPDDLDAMVRVQRQAGREGHAEVWERSVSDPDRCVLVAEVVDLRGAAVVIGWAQTHHHTEPSDAAPPGHYLGGVTVVPDHRRRGVAAALTDARMGWLWDRTDEAFYVVNPANRASIDLHHRWGFTEVLRAGRLAGVTFTGGTGILLRAER